MSYNFFFCLRFPYGVDLQHISPSLNTARYIQGSYKNECTFSYKESNLGRNWNGCMHFVGTHQHRISWISTQRFSHCDVRIDGSTDGHSKGNRCIFATSHWKSAKRCKKKRDLLKGFDERIFLIPRKSMLLIELDVVSEALNARISQ